MMKEVECEAEMDYVSVPVAEIVLDPLNFAGKTVSVAFPVRSRDVFWGGWLLGIGFPRASQQYVQRQSLRTSTCRRE